MLSRKALAASVEATGGGGGAWDVSGASYTGSSYDTIGLGTPEGFRWRPDGTAYYITNSNIIYEFTASSAFVPSYTSGSNSFTVSAVSTFPGLAGLIFNPDGTKVYAASSNDIHQINLSTAWDLSTASYYGVNGTATTASCVYLIGFNSDGTKIFYINAGTFYEVNLSTAYDITTASNGSSYTVPSGTGSNQGGGTISSDGSQIIYPDLTTDYAYVIDLSTAYDLSTASLSSSYYFGGTQTQGDFIEIVDGSTDFWILRTGDDFVYKYTM